MILSYSFLSTPFLSYILYCTFCTLSSAIFHFIMNVQYI
nr:MAG TPA: hypothetical protein [Caudoviricetes sp.]